MKSIQKLIDKKIRFFKNENEQRYNEYIQKISDIAMFRIVRNKNKFIWHGFMLPALIAIDKIAFNRWDSTINLEHQVDYLIKGSEGQALVNKAMINQCLSVENNSKKTTLELFLNYLLFVLGSKDHKKLDESITKEMIKVWYDNFKIANVAFIPYPYLTEHTDFNYYSCDFENFYNSNTFDIEDFLIINKLDNEDKITLMALKIEMLLYAPYFLKAYNNIFI